MNIPHSNWIPCEHLPWLILELEMNITIRKVQVDVARHMIEPTITSDKTNVRNIVRQMNMGEGKTAVIIPMLALSLCSQSLVRLVVLKSLFMVNYQALHFKLGGLLNRRVFPFACRRDMNFNELQITQSFDRLQQGFQNCGVVITSPEDVLDESDEILHVKYQLTYTIGGQQKVDGGVERWKTIQMVLNIVKQNAHDIAECYKNDVYYKPSQCKSAFSDFRLLSHQPYGKLCKIIAENCINQKNYRPSDLIFYLRNQFLS
ncbi:unnamed protein product [Rotaria sp. Silwood2]|nr:unnamed protein product [Rotaria sp. Silwood2]CAF3432178.1 unnamed protein product [Rotaria sp. Silwood2]CAF4480630.1 unnamed protein product [Rotaria sp. Silwood2]CAF4532374.1 unnamed protein product [Rotaria sp. Silwood2]